MVGRHPLFTLPLYPTPHPTPTYPVSTPTPTYPVSSLSVPSRDTPRVRTVDGRPSSVVHTPSLPHAPPYPYVPCLYPYPYVPCLFSFCTISRHSPCKNCRWSAVIRCSHSLFTPRPTLPLRTLSLPLRTLSLLFLYHLATLPV